MSTTYNGNATNISGNLNTAKSIVSSTFSNPTKLTVTGHGLTTNDYVNVAGHLTNTAANGVWQVTVIDPNTFSIPVAGIAAGTGGNETPLSIGPVVTVPSDGDADSAASVNGALKALADRTAFIWSGVWAWAIDAGGFILNCSGAISANVFGAITSGAFGGISASVAGGITDGGTPGGIQPTVPVGIYSSIGGGITSGAPGGITGRINGAIQPSVAGGINDGAVFNGIQATVPGGIRTLSKIANVTSAYTILTTDQIVLLSAGVNTPFLLPAAPVDGEEHYISDYSGITGSGIVLGGNGKNIYVNTGAASSITITPTHPAVNLIYSAAIGAWVQIATKF